MTADGMRKDLSVALGAKFERYRLPLPPSGPEAQEALRRVWPCARLAQITS